MKYAKIWYSKGMRDYEIFRLIVVFLGVAALSFGAAPLSALADTPIFLRPYKTHEANKDSENSSETTKPKQKSTIFLKPQKDTRRNKSIQFSRRATVSPVFRNDLSVYKDLKGLDLIKLTSAGGNPDNAEDMLRIAAAHRLPVLKQTLAMRKALNRPAHAPVIRMAKLTPFPNFAETDFVVGGVQDVQTAAKKAKVDRKNVKLIYKGKKKKPVKPWRLFGN